MYDYIRRAYGVEPIVGREVVHRETGKRGRIAPESAASGHYVMVKFPDYGDIRPCHPTSLDYSPENQG